MEGRYKVTSTSFPASSEFFRKLAVQCCPHIERFTIPFYVVQDEQVKLNRTGVLYRIADHHFILTASHGLGGIVGQNIPLYILPADAGAVPLPLMGATFHWTEEDNGRDVAAIKLSPDCVKKLQPANAFLTHGRIDQCDDGCGLYLVFGYPMEWSGLVGPEKLVSRPLVYATRRYESELSPEAYYDANVHIVLEFNQETVDALGGGRSLLPSIKGVSGSGIWRVASWNAGSVADWSPKQLRLVALQNRKITHGNRSYIQGTWVKYALGLILDNYPDLRRAMNLVYPREDAI